MVFRRKLTIKPTLREMRKADHIHQAQSGERDRSCMKCYAKWDKRLAAVAGVVLFLALFSTVIYQAWPTKQGSPYNGTSKFVYQRSYRTDKCSLSNCKVSCSNILTTDDLEKEIKDLIKLENSSCKIDLQLGILELPNNRIPTNWLNKLGTEVGKLTISKSPQIKEIEDGAFSSPNLQTISELALTNTGIVQLRKGVFKDMRILNTFRFDFNELTFVTMEADVFDHVNSLATLQLNKCVLTSETIRNMTGSNVHLPHLVNLDLGHNNIDSLESDVFRRIPNLQSLYLMNSGLKSLEVGVFDQFSVLKLYHLEGNSLTTLPKGIFPSIALTSNGGIKLNGNPWRCDCDLAWLKELYLNSECISKNPSPKCDNIILFEEEDFCPASSTDDTPTTPTTESTVGTNTTTTSTSVTTPIPTPTTTSTTVTTTMSTTTSEIPAQHRKITCNPIQDPIYASIERELIEEQTLTIREKTFNFKFYQINTNPVRIEVNISTEAVINDFHLLWFNSYDPSEEGCIKHLRPYIALDNLKYNNTYTICILYNTSTTVAPHDCFGLKVLEEYPERAWIKNKMKNVAILVVLCGIVATLVISACLMYWCIRCNPKLIKGNKRVIIIGKQKPKPQSVLIEYERPAYVTPSLDSRMSIQAASYMTTSNGYCRIKERNKEFPLASIHEESIYSGNRSYVNPMSQQELSNWRQVVLIPRASGESSADDNSLYEQVPPPLPPPNQQPKIVVAEKIHYTTA